MQHENISNTENYPFYLPWCMWALGLVFALLQFFTQLATGHMTGQLMQTFELEAIGIGYLSAAFFYTFLLMQIPAGLLLDRFGTKVVLTVALLCFTAGCWAFASAEWIVVAWIGRLLMGMGSAFGFIGMLSLAAGWFSSQYFVFIVAWSEAVVMIMVAMSQVLLPGWIAQVGWREVILTCAECSSILALLFALFIRQAPSSDEQKQNGFKISLALQQTLMSKQAWLNGLVSGTMGVLLTVFAALWGVPFLMHVHELSAEQAGWGIALVLTGIALGAPLMGWWSNRLKLRRPVLLINTFAMLIGMFLLITLENLSLFWVYSLLLFLGLTNGTYVLCFSIAKEISLPANRNTAMGFINMLTMSGSIILQPVIGYILAWNEIDEIVEGIPHYGAADYRYAFTVLIFSFILSCFFAWCLKETHCKDQCSSQH